MRDAATAQAWIGDVLAMRRRAGRGRRRLAAACAARDDDWPALVTMERLVSRVARDRGAPRRDRADRRLAREAPAGSPAPRRGGARCAAGARPGDVADGVRARGPSVRASDRGGADRLCLVLARKPGACGRQAGAARTGRRPAAADRARREDSVGRLRSLRRWPTATCRRSRRGLRSPARGTKRSTRDYFVHYIVADIDGDRLVDEDVRPPPRSREPSAGAGGASSGSQPSRRWPCVGKRIVRRYSEELFSRRQGGLQ